jgi:hypothetical protein
MNSAQMDSHLPDLPNFNPDLESESIIGIHFLVSISYPHSISSTQDSDNRTHSVVIDCLASEQLQVLGARITDQFDLKTGFTRSAVLEMLQENTSSSSKYNRDTSYFHLTRRDGSSSVNTQDKLKLYLNSIGIDEDINFFVLAHSRYKEQMEYTRWLEQIARFTSPPVSTKSKFNKKGKEKYKENDKDELK